METLCSLSSCRRNHSSSTHITGKYHQVRTWGGGGNREFNPPPPPFRAKIYFFRRGWGFFFFLGGGGVNSPPPPPPPWIRIAFFFCLSERLVMDDGYPYSVSGKLTQNFWGRKKKCWSPALPSAFSGLAQHLSWHACNVKPPSPLKKSCICHWTPPILNTKIFAWKLNAESRPLVGVATFV